MTSVALPLGALLVVVAIALFSSAVATFRAIWVNSLWLLATLVVAVALMHVKTRSFGSTLG